jgi:hypothetical protein
MAAQEPMRIGARSIRLFLVRLRPRRARLRFTGHNPSYSPAQKKSMIHLAFAPVPEPSTLTLLGATGSTLLWSARRRSGHRPTGC